MSWKRWMFFFELWSKRLHRLQTCSFCAGVLQKQGYKTKNPASKCRIYGGAYRIRTGDLYNAKGLCTPFQGSHSPVMRNFPTLYVRKIASLRPS